MNASANLPREDIGDFTEQVARQAGVERSMVLVFRDFADAMTALFKTVDELCGEVIVAGHASPDVAIAIDRAEMELTEVLGSSPFCGDPGRVLDAVAGGDEILYVANPNRITGTVYFLSELEAMARAVPGGALIIDEHFFDFCRFTGIPLLRQFTNVVIVRSFITACGHNSNESGFMVAEPRLTKHLRDAFEWNRVSTTISRSVTAALVGDVDQGLRFKDVCGEAARLATDLGRLGVESRVGMTDFLLMRVADPKQVGNYLAEQRVAIENLDGYPELKHYIRYTVQPGFSGDRLLDSFKKMPIEYYRMTTMDKRAIRLHGRIQEQAEDQLADSRKGTLRQGDPSNGRQAVLSIDDREAW